MKVAECIGVTKTRPIFEVFTFYIFIKGLQKGIKILKDKEKIKIGMRFADLERKLGEIDRARAIYNHIC